MSLKYLVTYVYVYLIMHVFLQRLQRFDFPCVLLNWASFIVIAPKATAAIVAAAGHTSSALAAKFVICILQLKHLHFGQQRNNTLCSAHNTKFIQANNNNNCNNSQKHKESLLQHRASTELPIECTKIEIVATLISWKWQPVHLSKQLHAYR